MKVAWLAIGAGQMRCATQAMCGSSALQEGAPSKIDLHARRFHPQVGQRLSYSEAQREGGIRQ